MGSLIDEDELVCKVCNHIGTRHMMSGNPSYHAVQTYERMSYNKFMVINEMTQFHRTRIQHDFVFAFSNSGSKG